MNRQLLANQPAIVFRDLRAAWNQDAASHRVDTLASELAAHVGRSRAPLCLGLIKPEAAPSLYGLVFLLDQFGLTLRIRPREDKRGAFVFLERKPKETSAFEGKVTEKPARRGVPA